MLFDANDLLKLIKQTAMDAVNASKPANMIFGKVISASPLKIQTEQKLPLGANQLVLSRNVTDFETEVTPLDWLTENRSGGGGYAEFASHNHLITGRKKIIVHNKLKVGDEVILMQVSGGQNYIVIDRIGKG